MSLHPDTDQWNQLFNITDEWAFVNVSKDPALMRKQLSIENMNCPTCFLFSPGTYELPSMTDDRGLRWEYPVVFKGLTSQDSDMAEGDIMMRDNNNNNTADDGCPSVICKSSDYASPVLVIYSSAGVICEGLFFDTESMMGCVDVRCGPCKFIECTFRARKGSDTVKVTAVTITCHTSFIQCDFLSGWCGVSINSPSDPLMIKEREVAEWGNNGTDQYRSNIDDGNRGGLLTSETQYKAVTASRTSQRSSSQIIMSSNIEGNIQPTTCHLTVVHVTMRDCGFTSPDLHDAICAFGMCNLDIQHLSIEEITGCGLVLGGRSTGEVQECHIARCKGSAGVALECLSDVTLVNNTIVECAKVGVWISGASTGSIVGCKIEGNGMKVMYGKSGGYFPQVLICDRASPIIYKNEFIGFTGSVSFDQSPMGSSLLAITDATSGAVDRNTFRLGGSDRGIVADGITSCVIKRNYFLVKTSASHDTTDINNKRMLNEGTKRIDARPTGAIAVYLGPSHEVTCSEGSAIYYVDDSAPYAGLFPSIGENNTLSNHNISSSSNDESNKSRSNSNSSNTSRSAGDTGYCTVVPATSKAQGIVEVPDDQIHRLIYHSEVAGEYPKWLSRSQVSGKELNAYAARIQTPRNDQHEMEKDTRGSVERDMTRRPYKKDLSPLQQSPIATHLHISSPCRHSCIYGSDDGLSDRPDMFSSRDYDTDEHEGFYSSNVVKGRDKVDRPPAGDSYDGCREDITSPKSRSRSRIWSIRSSKVKDEDPKREIAKLQCTVSQLRARLRIPQPFHTNNYPQYRTVPSGTNRFIREIRIGRYMWDCSKISDFRKRLIPIYEVRRKATIREITKIPDSMPQNSPEYHSSGDKCNESFPIRLHDICIEKRKRRAAEREHELNESIYYNVPQYRFTRKEQQESILRLHDESCQHQKEARDRARQQLFQHERELMFGVGGKTCRRTRYGVGRVRYNGVLVPLSEDELTNLNRRIYYEDQTNRIKKLKKLYQRKLSEERYLGRVKKLPKAEIEAYCTSLSKAHKDPEAAEKFSLLSGNNLYIAKTRSPFDNYGSSLIVNKKVAPRAEIEAYCTSLSKAHKDPEAAERLSKLSGKSVYVAKTRNLPEDTKIYLPNQKVVPWAEIEAYCTSLSKAHKDPEAAEKFSLLSGNNLYIAKTRSSLNDYGSSMVVNKKVAPRAEIEAYCNSLYTSHKYGKPPVCTDTKHNRKEPQRAYSCGPL